MSRTHAARLPAVLLSAALLTACGSGDGGRSDTASGGSSASSSSSSASSAAPSATSSSSASTAPSASAGGGQSGNDPAAPQSPATKDPDGQQASADARVTVRDIRLGRQDGYDRVVFELGGTGTPGWEVGYVDQASSQGSGRPVDVVGEAVLQVTITGAGYPYDTGVPEYAGPNPLPGAGTRTVVQVVYDHTFEGTSVAFVGTTAKEPFRVYALSNPTRVVVEVQDA